MCGKAVEEEPQLLEFVPDYYKTQEKHEKAVSMKLEVVMYASDWFSM